MSQEDLDLLFLVNVPFYSAVRGLVVSVAAYMSGFMPKYLRNAHTRLYIKVYESVQNLLFMFIDMYSANNITNKPINQTVEQQNPGTIMALCAQFFHIFLSFKVYAKLQSQFST